MPRYTITANVTVGLMLDVEADSEDGALSLFHDRIAMNATMIDCNPIEFDVNEDGIDDIQDIQITAA